MVQLQKHVRNTFLAGIFAAVPIVVTAFILWWVESKTRPAAHYLMVRFLHIDRDIPFLGVALAIVGIYLAGMITTSLIGKFFLGSIDRILLRVPILRQVYSGWKQVALTPGGTEGIFSKVALIHDEAGHTLVLAFTSGRPVDGQPDILCVFVPFAPNPVSGQLRFVRRSSCRIVEVSTEEALKVILSTGNYVPGEVGAAAALLIKACGTEGMQKR
ncbi:MAG TPA: DUF502 domain-containing protein [Humisphaera sp.]|jgi:uncharacterized membrane protein|nr:DUF502 domain-containing protein [Humisphaera sp.]